MDSASRPLQAPPPRRRRSRRRLLRARTRSTPPAGASWVGGRRRTCSQCRPAGRRRDRALWPAPREDEPPSARLQLSATLNTASSTLNWETRTGCFALWRPCQICPVIVPRTHKQVEFVRVLAPQTFDVGLAVVSQETGGGGCENGTKQMRRGLVLL